MSNHEGQGPGGDAEIAALDQVAIRFAGDSGDGMQLTGTQFTSTTALFGNDLATLPDFPAEIRAPAGTLAGVSGFQIQFGSQEVFTPGDRPDVLVAMNPAALKANLGSLEPGAMVFVNTDAFDERASVRVGFAGNPLEDDTLEAFRVFPIAFTKLTRGALEGSELSSRERDRCKNFFALGLMYWVFGRPLDHTERWLDDKFSAKPVLADANKRVLRAGYHFGETTELGATSYKVRPAAIKPGTYRFITGNQATAFGFIAAAKLAGADLFLGSYPITPASDILHELSKHKRHGVKTFQAEDEIAAVAAAIGAAWGGAIALTTTSGPGVALKGEAIGLAAITELPLVICNVQRGGPSTGLPTKTEQADLMQAMYGRNGEAPVPIVAARGPSSCFHAAIEAVRLATKYMTPVFFLSDGYIANGAEPWLLPDVETLPDISVDFHTETDGFQPYARDPQTLARPWVPVGTPGLERLVDAFSLAARKAGDVPLPPEPLDAAREALRMRLGLADADWIDGSRPVKLAIPDSKTWLDGFLAVLPIRGGEATVKKAFGDALTPAEGHAGVVTAEGRSVYLDFDGDDVIVSSHADLLGKVRSFVDGPLKAWAPAQPLVLEASVENANRIFAQEIAVSRKMAGAITAQLTKHAAVPAHAATLRAGIDGAFDFIDGTERFGFCIDPVGGAVRISLGLRGLAGSDLATSVAELKGRTSGLSELLPPSTWFGATVNVPSSGMTDGDRALLEALLTADDPDSLAFTKEEAAALSAAIHRLSGLATGDSASAIATDGAYPAALSVVTASSDGHASREVLLSIARRLFDKALAKVRADLAAKTGEPVAQPVEDLASALAFVNQNLSPMGVTGAIVDEARDGDARVQALIVSFDWDKIGLAAQSAEQLAAVKALVGPRLAIAIASTKERLAFAMGPHAVDQAVAMARGEQVGGEPALTAAAEGSFGTVSLRPGLLLKALAPFPSLKDKAAAIAKLPAEPAFILEADSDGTTLVATLHVPLDLLMALLSIE